MSNKLELIRQKVEAIQHGLLRFSEGAMRQTMEVRALTADDSGVSFIVKDEEYKKSLLNREVNLIQKKDDDYLYISGLVDEEVKSPGKIIRLKIMKAFWFTRKKKGAAVWLQEKFIYEDEGIEKAS